MSLYKINICQNHKLQPLIINRSQSLKRVTNPDVQSVDLGYDALEDETSDDSPGEGLEMLKQNQMSMICSTNSELLMPKKKHKTQQGQGLLARTQT